MSAASTSVELSLPVKDQASQLWERYMRSYDYLNCVESYSRSLTDIASCIQPRAGMDILDAGSGTGNLSELLAARGANVLSCDISNAALEVHRKKNPNARLLQASLEHSLPLTDSQFDSVCCASVLFALSRSGCSSAISEFFRVLRPGGQLVLTVATPSKSNLALLKRHLVAIIRKSKWGEVLHGLVQIPTLIKILYYNRELQKLPDWQGYHRFTEDELRALAETAGFTGIEVSKTYGGGFFLLTARKA